MNNTLGIELPVNLERFLEAYFSAALAEIGHGQKSDSH